MILLNLYSLKIIAKINRTNNFILTLV